jgi:hypothetical protein
VVRAANAIVYLFCPSADGAATALGQIRGNGFRVVVESMPPGAGLEQWAEPGSALPVMQKLKATFDPKLRLSPGRLWGRL